MRRFLRCAASTASAKALGFERESRGRDDDVREALPALPHEQLLALLDAREREAPSSPTAMSPTRTPTSPTLSRCAETLRRRRRATGRFDGSSCTTRTPTRWPRSSRTNVARRLRRLARHRVRPPPTLARVRGVGRTLSVAATGDVVIDEGSRIDDVVHGQQLPAPASTFDQQGGKLTTPQPKSEAVIRTRGRADTSACLPCARRCTGPARAVRSQPLAVATGARARARPTPVVPAAASTRPSGRERWRRCGTVAAAAIARRSRLVAQDRARPRGRDPTLPVHELLRRPRPAAQAGHLPALGPRARRRHALAEHDGRGAARVTRRQAPADSAGLARLGITGANQPSAEPMAHWAGGGKPMSSIRHASWLFALSFLAPALDAQLQPAPPRIRRPTTTSRPVGTSTPSRSLRDGLRVRRAMERSPISARALRGAEPTLCAAARRRRSRTHTLPEEELDRMRVLGEQRVGFFLARFNLLVRWRVPAGRSRAGDRSAQRARASRDGRGDSVARAAAPSAGLSRRPGLHAALHRKASARCLPGSPGWLPFQINPAPARAFPCATSSTANQGQSRPCRGSKRS